MTETDAANSALGKVGSFRVASLNENSPEAAHCKRFFAETRQALLREFHWNFADAWQVLNQVDETAKFDMDFVYALPADYLTALSFDRVPAGISQTHWKIAGGRLYSNMGTAANAKLDYIRDVPDVTEWDSDFYTAFAWYLAAAIAPSITKNPESALTLLQAGRAFLQDAKGVDTHETAIRIMRGTTHSKIQQARSGGSPNNLPGWMYQNYNVSHQ